MDILAIANAGICAVLCCVLGWLIMAPTVRDGIIVKIGLILSALGLLACALVLLQHDGSDWRPLLIAWLGVHLGALVAGGGLVLHVMRDPQARQAVYRITGFGHLDESGADHG